MGNSMDADLAVEYYTNATITIDSPTDSDHIGYYIGYWLDRFVNPNETSPTFNRTGSEARDDW
ncbi:MAG: hypothetical protein J07HQW2_01873 [Haloquadratum walsbyi J07HQW2]|uniref:Uncharacterized protein n=2 Tax=Haloquadratum walsbyi TaxID=293091 RepID=U1PST4_9EURY|nr:MAG: hypothetical protein J07HQW2_01873 [Haloquadratum walsbyi J07HQW2]